MYSRIYTITCRQVGLRGRRAVERARRRLMAATVIRERAAEVTRFWEALGVAERFLILSELAAVGAGVADAGMFRSRAFHAAASTLLLDSEHGAGALQQFLLSCLALTRDAIVEEGERTDVRGWLM